MTTRAVRLSYRRTGSTTEVDIDLSTPAGQRLLARFKQPHPEKENGIMTTTATRLSHAPRPIGVPGEPVQSMGLLVQAKLAAQRLGNRLSSARRGAWDWIRRTFHLDAVAASVSSAWGWVKSMVSKGIGYLGLSGTAGLGMLAVSTDVGRKIIGFALKPVGWVLKAIGWSYVWVEETLRNDSKGGIRNWLADRMAGGREFLFHADTHDRKRLGLVPRAAMWFVEHFAGAVALDGWLMRSIRAAGTFLFGMRSVALLALFPLGGWLLPVQMIGSGFTIAAAATPFSKEIDRAWGDVRRTATGNAKAADQIVEGTVTDLKRDVHTAAKASAGTPPNRDSRRAEKTTTPPRRGH